MELTGIDKANRNQLIRVIRERMVTRNEDITCSGGEATKTYLDIPGALGDSAALKLATQVLGTHILYNVPSASTMTAIGGPTTGSIPMVMGIAMGNWCNELRWFIVRDKIKGHGLGRLFVGAEPGPGDKVILTDDVVSSGESLADTAMRVLHTGAQILAVVPLVDRGERGRKAFQWDIFKDVAYLPVLTYKDLGIDPLGA